MSGQVCKLQSLEKWDCSEVKDIAAGLPGISFIPEVGILDGQKRH